VEAYASQIIGQDRGLGTAYERWCFYQRMNGWAREYGVESALEGPVDGVAGVRGVHCAGLARDGVRVVSAVPSAESARVAKGVYADVAPAAAFDVRVVSDEDGALDLPASDLVLVYHALPFVRDWRRYLDALGRRAKKVLIVATCNPDNWGFTAVRWLGGVPAPAVWNTGTLAPALWELGRVREHAYFDAPWWPDLPVAPGQSLAHRLKQLVVGSGGARFAAPERGAILSSKYVYGPGRWPYFGGPAWLDELEPALLRHPAFEGSSPAIVRRAAHLHAFVVDMRPRSPQARRRLAQSA
jgi:hypothetical protein